MSTIIKCTNCGADVDSQGSSSPYVKCQGCSRWVKNVPAPTSPSGPASSVGRPSGGGREHLGSEQPSKAPPARPEPARQSFASPSFNPGASSTPQRPSTGGLTPPEVTTEGLPEIMKANKRLAGKSCPACYKTINLGDPVHNCQKCGQPNHQACWINTNGCGSPSCARDPMAQHSQMPSVGAGRPASGFANDPLAQQPSGAPPGDIVPCRFCKELIIRGARKCKHCNEYQHEVDRATNKSVAALDDNDPDSVISISDWFMIILCPCIACVGGIVLSIQGKPKGPKILLYSILSVVFWNMLNLII